MYPIKEAAPKLHISESKLRQLVAQRKIPHLRVGSKILFTQEDIDTFLAGCRVEPANQKPTCAPRFAVKHLSLDG